MAKSVVVIKTGEDGRAFACELLEDIGTAEILSRSSGKELTDKYQNIVDRKMWHDRLNGGRYFTAHCCLLLLS